MCMDIYLSIYKVFEFLTFRTKPDIENEDNVYYNEKIERE